MTKDGMLLVGYGTAQTFVVAVGLHSGLPWWPLAALQGLLVLAVWKARVDGLMDGGLVLAAVFLALFMGMVAAFSGVEVNETLRNTREDLTRSQVDSLRQATLLAAAVFLAWLATRWAVVER